jgi:hypothetical protein
MHVSYRVNQEGALFAIECRMEPQVQTSGSRWIYDTGPYAVGEYSVTEVAVMNREQLVAMLADGVQALA